MSSNNQNITILFQAGACEFYFRCLFILQRKTFQEVRADQSRFPDSKDIKVIRQLLLQYLSWLLICSWTSQHSELYAQNSSSIFTFPSVHICFYVFLCLFYPLVFTFVLMFALPISIYMVCHLLVGKSGRHLRSSFSDRVGRRQLICGRRRGRRCSVHCDLFREDHHHDHNHHIIISSYYWYW